VNKILTDFTLRFITDDVSDGRGTEYRCSVYDTESNLLADGWGATPAKAMLEAIEYWQRN